MGIVAAGRILYFNHDNPHPSGGVRTIYAHVAHLNRHGLAAFVVHQKPGFRPGWFSESVPALSYGEGLAVTPADVLVVPEDLPILGLLKALPSKKIVFCQNHFYAFNGLKPGETWRSLGVSHVLASSEVIAKFVQENLGWSDVPVVHYAVDRQFFKPREKKLQIAYMPRKRSMEARFIRELFATLGGQTAGWKWVEIDGLAIGRVADILAESAIFLSLSYLEGFGLPPVEAMASGCAVVGYHGEGGLEYATEENGFWCEEQNPCSCAALLRNVADRFLREDARIRAVINMGMQTAARYTPERQEEEIVRFMRQVLAET
jgi:hypothetical protein